MRTEIEYTNRAIKDLTKLSHFDAQKIIKKLGFYTAQKNPLTHAKKLNFPFNGFFRFRIGAYRAIFDIDNKGNVSILMIFTIKHRKDAYHNK